MRIGLSCLFALTALPLSVADAQAPSHSFTTPGEVYSEDFDTLPDDPGAGAAAWTDASMAGFTLAAWYAEATASAEEIAADDGAATTARLYAYGDDLDADRALGSLSDSTTSHQAIGVRLDNTTGETIAGLSIAFTVEHWRDSEAADHVLSLWYRVGGSTFDLATNATTWTTLPDGDATVAGNIAGQLDGDDPANQQAISVDLTGLALADGESIWIGWRDADESGNDHGLAVDDLTVTLLDPPVLLDEPFSSYQDGEAISDTGQNPDTEWTGYAGTTDPLVTAGELVLDEARDGDVRRTLLAAPFGLPQGDGRNVLFAGCVLRFSAVPTVAARVLQLMDTTATHQWGRVFLTPTGAPAGMARIGISVEAAAPGAVIDTINLEADTTYALMLRLDMTAAEPVATVWINPASESDTTHTATASDVPAAPGTEMADLALLQEPNCGTIVLDWLRVAGTFANALPPVLTLVADNPADAGVGRDTAGVIAAQFTATANDHAAIALGNVTVDATGTVHDVDDLANASLWVDRDDSGTLDTTADAPALATGGTFSGDNGSVTFAAPGHTVDAGITDRFFVTVDIGSTPLNATTFMPTVSAVVVADGVALGLPVAGRSLTVEAPVIQFADGGSGDLDVAAGEATVVWPVTATALLGAATLDTVTLDASGTLTDDSDVASVLLALDANGNGEIDTDETLDSGAFDSDDGSVTLAAGISLALDEAADLLVAIGLDADAPDAGTLILTLADAAITDAEPDGLPLTGPTVTVAWLEIAVSANAATDTSQEDRTGALLTIDLTAHGADATLTDATFNLFFNGRYGGVFELATGDGTSLATYTLISEDENANLGENETGVVMLDDEDVTFAPDTPLVIADGTTQRLVLWITSQRATARARLDAATVTGAAVAGLPSDAIGTFTFKPGGGAASLVALAVIALAVLGIGLSRRPARP